MSAADRDGSADEPDHASPLANSRSRILGDRAERHAGASLAFAAQHMQRVNNEPVEHAVFRRESSASQGSRKGDAQARGRALGMFSAGLGLAELLSPSNVASLVGVPDRARSRWVLRVHCVAVVNRALTIRSGQCHVHRYLKPLLHRIELGEIDPSFVITHRLPLSQAARGFGIFHKKLDGCEKVVLKAA